MKLNRILSLDREDISELEKRLFLEDLKKVCDEHFERLGEIGIDVTRTDDGFSVCVIFGARRIKNAKRPLQ
ncbi:MAG: hypothetical protein E7370_04195 [Clostridiales bacterium]|nr:hypothetical protein [Clostridiales bacterium]